MTKGGGATFGLFEGPTIGTTTTITTTVRPNFTKYLAADEYITNPSLPGLEVLANAQIKRKISEDYK